MKNGGKLFLPFNFIFKVSTFHGITTRQLQIIQPQLFTRKHENTFSRHIISTLSLNT